MAYLVIGILVGGSALLVCCWFQRRSRTHSAAALKEAVRALFGGAAESPLQSRLSNSDRSTYAVVAEQTATLSAHLARIEGESDLILSQIADGILVVNADRVVIRVNRSQAERLCLEQERIVGRSLIKVLHDHEVDGVARRCMESGREERARVEMGPTKRFMQVVATPFEDGTGCVLVLQDRTELRRLERVRREFVANISHELRTPLATLKLLSETLSMGGWEDQEVLKDYLGRIEIEVDRLAQMVDELGELSLIETGQVILEKAPVDVSLLVRRSAERLDAQASRAGLTIHLDVQEGVPRPCGDARRLEQVLVNLLHNAIKFTTEGGVVRVSASEVDEVVRISVQDTGIGIADDDLERIFERFYKSDKSRSSTGTGLGLAIARHIVELHGGTIRAESVLGRGSTFSFTLPLVDEQSCE